MGPKAKRSPSKGRGKGKGKGRTSRSSTRASSYHPDDIFPLVLTSATQELFNCRIDEDVTEKHPFKLLKKDDIIDDMKTRAAISDFSPVKHAVLDYPEEEMLLVFDSNLTYGQCFYLVLTPESKERILKTPEAEELLESEKRPKLWIPLGSEKEIEEPVKETREKLRLKLRLDREGQSEVCFSDRDCAESKDSHLECTSYEDSKFKIKKLMSDCGVQAVPMLQTNGCQTMRMVPKDTFTQYEPREFSTKEKEMILKEQNLRDFCGRQIPRMLFALQQEEIINVFLDDWRSLATGIEICDWSGQVSDTLVLHQVFTDQKFAKNKTISCLNWHPTIHGVVAVALTKRHREPAETASSPPLIVFYSFSDPSNPQFLLECPDDILAFQFSPSNPNIIVGGCINGQILLWDLSAHVTYIQASQPSSRKDSTSSDKFDLNDSKENIPIVRFCAVSALESSHKAPVTDVQWLPPTFEVTILGLPVENKQKVSVQIITCSPDCTLRFWDVRLPAVFTNTPTESTPAVDHKTPMTTCSVPETFKHLDRTWKPLFRVSLSKIDTKGEYVPMKFSFENVIAPTDKDIKGTEVFPDYSQLMLPASEKLREMDSINTKFFVGTENGEIIYSDWKMESDDSGRPHSSKPFACFNTHHWLVNTVQRSPFFKDILLTTGGWNFAIWKEGVMDGPLVASQYFEQECTVGCWSLSRPAVFFIGKTDGSVEIWDMLKNSSEPLQLHAHISKSKITCMKACSFTAEQHFLAVADDLGVLRIFEIPKALYLPFGHEDLSMKRYFDLEAESLKDYLKREENWTKQKKEEEEMKLKQKMEPEKPETPPKEIQRLDLTEYSDDLILEEELLQDMGLWPIAAESERKNTEHHPHS
ncbi:dynein axonemal intermediate chain 3 isoform X1 [Poecilia formosa]|uniref:dynein axonemal intermediate chain 3 isoform X1 n=1 Tax=Poecilia formosa TaxID=48698 RepID=UPI0007BA8A92|nr:PREDICTED: WD repeat-containing protein 63 isoform X1 [Poecilia formosa]